MTKKRKVATEQLVGDRLRSFVDDLVTALEARLGEHLDALLARARDAAVESISADIRGGQPMQAEELEVEVAEVVAAPKLATKTPGVVTCRKCGFVGGNARGCGTAHQPAEVPARAAGARSTPFPAPFVSARGRAEPDRLDVIAKRAGALPTPVASADLGDEDED